MTKRAKMRLPTADLHQEAEADWTPSDHTGFSHRDRGVAAAWRRRGGGDGGAASVHVARPNEAATSAHTPEDEIHFTFVRSGEMTLEGEGEPALSLCAGDAFTTPPGRTKRYADASKELELLQVTLA